MSASTDQLAMERWVPVRTLRIMVAVGIIIGIFAVIPPLGDVIGRLLYPQGPQTIGVQVSPKQAKSLLDVGGWQGSLTLSREQKLSTLHRVGIDIRRIDSTQLLSPGTRVALIEGEPEPAYSLIEFWGKSLHTAENRGRFIAAYLVLGATVAAAIATGYRVMPALLLLIPIAGLFALPFVAWHLSGAAQKMFIRRSARRT